MKCETFMHAERNLAPMESFNPSGLERPDSCLLKYYALICLLTGPGFLVGFWPLFFKYETLRYKFESDGMSMSWGILFRHEIHLTYRRIQDMWPLTN